jgi:hypothetical protein
MYDDVTGYMANAISQLTGGGAGSESESQKS